MKVNELIINSKNINMKTIMYLIESRGKKVFAGNFLDMPKDLLTRDVLFFDIKKFDDFDFSISLIFIYME